MDLLKEATRDLFGYLGDFDRDWQDGWRPVIDPAQSDILFQSPLGSHVRCRKDERGICFAFKLLSERLAEPQTGME